MGRYLGNLGQVVGRWSLVVVRIPVRLNCPDGMVFEILGLQGLFRSVKERRGRLGRKISRYQVSRWVDLCKAYHRDRYEAIPGEEVYCMVLNFSSRGGAPNEYPCSGIYG